MYNVLTHQRGHTGGDLWLRHQVQQHMDRNT